MKDSALYTAGAEMRRQLLGDQRVEELSSIYEQPAMREFLDLNLEAVFGAIWTRAGLDLKTRSLVCVVSDTATGRTQVLAEHLRMALRQGWTEKELTEVLLHLVAYVGAPLVREAIQVAAKIFAEAK